ncbi:YdcF family protein [Thalassococcus sp. BH17M4-6]
MDTVFFVVAKLAGALLRPDTWIVIAVAGTVLLLLKKRHRLALVTSGVTVAVLLIVGIFPLGSLLLQPVERTYPANPPLSQVDGIIVLGGGEDIGASLYWDQPQLNEGGDRYVAGLALARRFPEARLLFAGGSGALRDVAGMRVSEASVAEQLFRAQGIAADRLLLEDRSRNTAENARLGLELAAPAEDETWVLVTSAFHMPRAMQSFRSAGWPDLVAWPVDYRTSRFVDGIGWNLSGNMQILGIAVREHVGRLAYRLSGR